MKEMLEKNGKEKHCLLRVEQGRCVQEEFGMAEPFNFEILTDEHIAIVGENGSGKSRLVDLLLRRRRMTDGQPTFGFPADNVRYITFRDSYGDADSGYYLQQRWNISEMDADIPTAGALLDRAFSALKDTSAETLAWRSHLYGLFSLHPLLEKSIILLSSGELRKFMLARALLSHPRLLVLDNPFIGLDAGARKQLTDLLASLTHAHIINIVLMLSRTDYIPDFLTHIYVVNSLHVGRKQTRSQYLSERTIPKNFVLPADTAAALSALPSPCEGDSDEVVRLRDVSIRYDGHCILSPLNWVVRRGECWALSGDNGSGKSTLLSLVCADNPQSYACDISLFGRKRGTGESRWEIKRRIGYVSPEMHRAYHANLPALRIVASGLTDSVGLYRQPKESDYEVCRHWMRLFGISDWEGRSFLQLSSGEQRLVLLVRTFVKDPELLVLDEPLHGLDDRRRRFVLAFIDAFCRRKGKTLIYVSHYADEFPSCITHRLHLSRPAEEDNL